MTVKACREMNTLRPFTNGDFSQTFVRQWVVSPRDISCHLLSGFAPSMARFVHDNTISKEVCWVFVLRRQSTSILPVLSLVPSSYLSHTVYLIVQVTFIHSCIHASTHQYFHEFTHSSVHNTHIHTQHQFIHDCISCPESRLVVSPQFSPQLFQVVSHKQWTTWIFLFSFFQVVSPKQWTTWVKWLVLNNRQLEFTFVFISSG